jgi:hypothetical protein
LSRTHLKRALTLCVALLTTYVFGYLGYRETHRQRWAFDGRDYVIFGSLASDYAFRPLSHLDQSITGVRTHIGPHR